MKDLLGRLFFLISLIVTAGFALLVVGLGYFFMTIALNFGWLAMLALIGIIAVVGVIEGSIWAVLTAPVTLFRNALRKTPTPAETDAAKQVSKLISLTMTLLLVLGALIATLQYLIKGPLG